jgi:hypothetical protein
MRSQDPLECFAISYHGPGTFQIGDNIDAMVVKDLHALVVVLGRIDRIHTNYICP